MPHGFRPGRLEVIDRFLRDQYVAAGRLPGTLLLIWRGGEPAFLSIRGHADVALGRPLSEDTIFRIYSMTKPITSVAAMMLVEEGRLALDDPVSAHIPAWRDLAVFVGGTARTGWVTRPPARAMTVLDLFRHTSGLTYGFQLRSNVDAAYRQAGIGEIEKSGTLGSMIAGLATIPLEFSPGEAWNYSVATDVLGHLVGELSGVAFEEFLEARIFGPVGMRDTGFHVPEAKAHRLATCYQPKRGGGIEVQDQAESSAFLAPPGFVSGGGGLVSTAADYMAFVEALRTGSADLVARRTFAQMTANHLPGGADLPAFSRSLFAEAAYAGVGFGLGFATTIDWTRTGLPGNNGDWFWGGAASTYFWCDPAEELSVVFLTQLIPSSTWPIRRQIRQLVYSALA
ncbi:serine hydrolase domain-containing protein [Thermaurantiacus sp.]